MRHVRKGQFQRATMPAVLRHFAPTESLHALGEVDLDALWGAGKRLILLDVDNTLIPWKGRDIPTETTEWIVRAKALGFELCVLSNTRHPERLKDVCARMDLKFIRDRFKPSRRMFNIALANFKRERNEAVMVGDQLFTDVFGANRSGIDALWIMPLGSKEFFGTSLISRNLERLVSGALYRYFQPHPEFTREAGLYRSGLLLSFMKFVGAGVVSTLVDLGLHWILMHSPLRVMVANYISQNITHVSLFTDKAISDTAFGPLKVGPVCLAILNSYMLNRALATFEGQQAKAAQMCHAPNADDYRPILTFLLSPSDFF